MQRPSLDSLTSDYIRYHAAQRPNGAAVIDQGKVFSFDVFNRDINRMLAALGDMPLTPGQMVGVEFLPGAGKFSSFYFHWLKLLALEALGVATLSFTRAEAPQMQQNLGALDFTLVFPEASKIPTKHQHVMTRDWITGTMARAPGEIPPQNQRHWNAASRVIKSSGTTGSMKYMIRSVENQEYIYRSCQLRGGFNRQSRFFAAGGFTVSAFHVAAVTCVRAGGVCVYDTRQSTAKALSSYAITDASFLVHSLMQMLETIPADYAKPSNLRILTIGSPVSAAVRARLLASLASDVSETYGTNESSTISTIDAVGMGAVLPGVEVEVVDDDDLPVTGTPGWIRVRSQGGVQGYLNNPAATEKMFRDGWFYPGDIGVKQDAHTLRVIGRADSILNIRGLKLAPEEFEEKLRDAVPVRDVCILTMPDHEGVEQVVIAVASGAHQYEKDITSKIQKVIPAFFGATRVIYVPDIPRTDTGKIERQALRKSLSNQ